MITYILLNVIFMMITLIVLRRYVPTLNRAWCVTALILIVLTAIFDNVIISLGIVAYDPHKILGLYIYKAPVEDFFYALLALYLVPALWRYFEGKGKVK
jgi:lycopene cyclase domain-containing protein